MIEVFILGVIGLGIVLAIAGLISVATSNDK